METGVNKLLTKLGIAHRVANEKAMCEIGLHAGQVQVLCSLWDRDGQSQAEIVRDLGVSPPTVNKMISRLEENEFITSKKCPKDRRLTRVFLSGKGRKIRKAVEKEWEKLESSLLTDLSDTERLVLPLLLRRINLSLQTVADKD